jgi:hypothetical protein
MSTTALEVVSGRSVSGTIVGKHTVKDFNLINIVFQRFIFTSVANLTICRQKWYRTFFSVFVLKQGKIRIRIQQAKSTGSATLLEKCLIATVTNIL